MKHRMFIFLAAAVFAGGCGNTSKSPDQNAAASSNTANANSNGMKATNANTQNLPTSVANTSEVPTYDNADAALEEGKKFFNTDEDEKAVKAFEQAVKLDPNLPEAQYQLALAYDAVDNQESAEKTYNAAIKSYLKFLVKNPKDSAAYFNLGHAYNKINEDQKAQKALQQAIKLKPEESEYHLELGNILIKLARYSEAIKELKKSLELDPENARAEASLEKAESGDNRVKAAQAKSKGSKDAKVTPVRNSAPSTGDNRNQNIKPSQSNIKITASGNTNR